jgi:energy-coupling factor transport system ATP-binding protein
MSWVEVSKFSYTYPGENTPVFRDLNFVINRGDFLVITGKSGCGKSTFGKALAGFLFQDDSANYSGKIIINSEDMTQLPLYEASRKVGYVQQNPEDQFCTLNVDDEIAFGPENLCVPPDEIEDQINQSLMIVKGIELRGRDLATLSGGEKQKVAIASMLALSPELLILDEPTSNLDPIATRNIFQTLHNLRESMGLTVIIFEHKLSQLVDLDPKFFVLDQGEIKPLGNNQYRPKSVNRINLSFPGKTSLHNDHKNTLIKVENLNVAIQDKIILQEINFEIVPGEFIALMGPNGSGKSTLLQSLVGFHPPNSGNIRCFDQASPNIKTSNLVMDIGFIFQNPDHQLFTQSVLDEVIFTSENLKILTEEITNLANKWLDQIELLHRVDDHPQRLSYGEKRRLNLIAAMLHNPRLLIIDELLIGQDMANALIWMKILHDYTKNGNSVLLVNHHPELTKEFCSRLIFLNEGRMLLDQPVDLAFESLRTAGFDSFVPGKRVSEINA